jgi:UDP-glucuronate 4-epimerase
MKVLITGVAGFIGFHLASELLDRELEVVGIDNLNDYYDPELKTARLTSIESHVNQKNFHFEKIDISDAESLNSIFEIHDFDVVVNLAAQAGVRYSLDNPRSYIDSNLVGFFNVLEACRNFEIGHLVFASSSSVYGANEKHPFSEKDRVDCPLSLYAASKKSNELMAYTYSHLYGIPVSGLRFFTVYGPFGRPDMAYYKFTKSIINGEPIDVYNYGKLKRDFTFISDIIEGVIRVMMLPPALTVSPGSRSEARYRLLNIGNSQPISLEEFISSVEEACGIKAIRNLLPMQPGDVPATFADVEEILDQFNFRPSTSIKVGMSAFVEWYREYYEET